MTLCVKEHALIGIASMWCKNESFFELFKLNSSTRILFMKVAWLIWKYVLIYVPTQSKKYNTHLSILFETLTNNEVKLKKAM